MREEHFVELKGKRHVLYSGLLAMAHEQGIESIEEEILQIPDETNGQLAICRATVTTKDGQTFMGIGDASPQNVGRNIVPHILRMASTRSKARALRDMCNVGVAALEELSDGDEASAPTQPRQGPQRATESRQEANQRLASLDQKKLLRDLLTISRGDQGVVKLEGHIGKSIDELTNQEAEEWIDRLTVEEKTQ